MTGTLAILLLVTGLSQAYDWDYCKGTGTPNYWININPKNGGVQNKPTTFVKSGYNTFVFTGKTERALDLGGVTVQIYKGDTLITVASYTEFYTIFYSAKEDFKYVAGVVFPNYLPFDLYRFEVKLVDADSKYMECYSTTAYM